MAARVVVLCGPNIQHKNTCATLINQGVNVVGICECDQTSNGLPIATLKRTFKKAPVATIGQVIQKVVYKILNGKKDARMQETLFDRKTIHNILDHWEGEVHHTTSYSGADTIDWLKEMNADIFVVHTPYWVSKKVREIPNKKIVIGGHPGLTPHYRGCHSAFWAIYNKEPHMVGYSVFWLDEGVDTGDLIFQEPLNVSEGDSYVTLGWKGMVKTAVAQSHIIKDYDNGIEIPRKPHKIIPDESNYPNPTIFGYIRYRFIQKRVR